MDRLLNFEYVRHCTSTSLARCENRASQFDSVFIASLKFSANLVPALVVSHVTPNDLVRCDVLPGFPALISCRKTSAVQGKKNFLRRAGLKILTIVRILLFEKWQRKPKIPR